MSLKRFDAKIAYIYSSIPGYVRTNKTLPVLVKLFKEVHYIGCNRAGKQDVVRPEGVQYHMAPTELSYGLRSIPGVLDFARYIRSVLGDLAPDVVLVVNDDYVLPFAVRYWPRPRFLVVDLWDSISMRLMGPERHLTPLWRTVSRFALGQVDGMVEVSEERLALHKQLPPVTAVVYNTPYFLDEVVAREGLPEDFIFVNGTLLDKRHGVESILAAVERVPQMKIVAAGKFVGRFLEDTFVNHPQVVNLGHIPHHEVFPVAAASRAIFSHCEPTIPIYLYGAANKHFEAMMIGTPLLINSENRASELYRRLGFGLVTDFGDVEGLATVVRRLVGGDPELDEACRKARQVFKEQYAWDHMEKRWEAFFTELGLRPLGSRQALPLS